LRVKAYGVDPRVLKTTYEERVVEEGYAKKHEGYKAGHRPEPDDRRINEAIEKERGTGGLMDKPEQTMYDSRTSLRESNILGFTNISTHLLFYAYLSIYSLCPCAWFHPI